MPATQVFLRSRKIYTCFDIGTTMRVVLASGEESKVSKQV